MRSTLGDYILWLRAVRNVQTEDAEANELCDAIETGEGHLVGVELYRGRPRSLAARGIMRRAMQELRNLDMVIFYVDECGYTTISLRSLLCRHYPALEAAELDSDAHAILLDIGQAVEQASVGTKAVVAMMINGSGPADIGKALGGTNGSRCISRACAELVHILEGPRRRCVDGVAR